MNCAKLSQIDTLESSETIKPNTLVFRNNDDFFSIFAELERAYNSANLYLVF